LFKPKEPILLELSVEPDPKQYGLPIYQTLCIAVLHGSNIFAILIQYFYYVVQSDPNPIVLSKYLIRSGLCPKKTLIKHLTALINAVWMSRSDPVEYFSKSSAVRIRSWIAKSGWIAIWKPDHVQRWCITKMLEQRFPTFLWLFTLQHFDRWACIPKISYDKKAEW